MKYKYSINIKENRGGWEEHRTNNLLEALFYYIWWFCKYGKVTFHKVKKSR